MDLFSLVLFTNFLWFIFFSFFFSIVFVVFLNGFNMLIEWTSHAFPHRALQTETLKDFYHSILTLCTKHEYLDGIFFAWKHFYKKVLILSKSSIQHQFKECSLRDEAAVISVDWKNWLTFGQIKSAKKYFSFEF